MNYQKEIDATGLKCPMPILKCKKGMSDLKSGDILKIITTDKSAHKDFEAFCQQTKHNLLEAKIKGESTTFFIQKK